MSVRVVEIQKPPEPMRSRCKCGALLEFERADVQRMEGRYNETLSFVTCPHCNKQCFIDRPIEQPIPGRRG